MKTYKLGTTQPLILDGDHAPKYKKTPIFIDSNDLFDHWEEPSQSVKQFYSRLSGPGLDDSKKIVWPSDR
mgnify:CR=1 FL=1